MARDKGMDLGVEPSYYQQLRLVVPD